MKTLQMLIDETSQSAVFGSILDQATEDDLAFYFATYEVYGDNFVHFLQRKEKLLKAQYNKYLALEAQTYDPLVTEYMHIVHDNTIGSEHDNTTAHTGHDNIVFGHTNTASGTDTFNRGTINTRTGSETDTDTRTTTRTGSEKTTDTTATTRTGSETDADTRTKTRTGSETDADTTYTEYQGSESVSTGNDSGAMAASTPPVSASTMDGFMGPIDGSSQGSGFQSGVTSESLTRSRTNSETSYTNRKDQRGGSTTKTYNSVSDANSGNVTKTYNNVADTHSGDITKTYQSVSDANSGSITKTYNQIKDTQSGSDSTQHGRVDTESGTNTNNFDSQLQDSGTDSRTEELDETREGYRGVPAEMLGKARNYILDTNAFRWLVTELLTCFMDIMEY